MSPHAAISSTERKRTTATSQHPRNQSPGMRPVRVVFGSEGAAHDLLFQPDLPRVGNQQDGHSNQSVPFSRCDRHSTMDRENTGINRMPEQSVRTRSDQLVADFGADFRAPIASKMVPRP